MAVREDRRSRVAGDVLAGEIADSLAEPRELTQPTGIPGG
jgi:hypothetical protein